MMSYSTSKHFELKPKAKKRTEERQFRSNFFAVSLYCLRCGYCNAVIVLRFRRWWNYVVLLVIFSSLQDVYILILCPLLFLSTKGKLFVYYHSTVMMVSWQGSVGNHHHSQSQFSCSISFTRPVLVVFVDQYYISILKVCVGALIYMF